MPLSYREFWHRPPTIHAPGPAFVPGCGQSFSDVWCARMWWSRHPLAGVRCSTTGVVSALARWAVAARPPEWSRHSLGGRCLVAHRGGLDTRSVSGGCSTTGVVSTPARWRSLLDHRSGLDTRSLRANAGSPEGVAQQRDSLRHVVLDRGLVDGQVAEGAGAGLEL